MAKSPLFKVYTAESEYVASCRYPSDAAAIVDLHGPGSTIRVGHAKKDTVWTEGDSKGGDGWAGDSYDEVADLCYRRMGV